MRVTREPYSLFSLITEQGELIFHSIKAISLYGLSAETEFNLGLCYAHFIKNYTVFPRGDMLIVSSIL